MKNEEYAKYMMKDYKDVQNSYKKKPRKTTKYHVTNRINDKFMADLKRERLELGLTQKEMASKLGISYDIYRKYESGKKHLFNEKWAMILRAFDYKILTPNKEILEY